ncbi:MAG: hypothetical protein KAF27_05140 [Porphyrobacter sp.]|nr:hypothetical protein [Porphyrobacter sp.]
MLAAGLGIAGTVLLGFAAITIYGFVAAFVRGAPIIAWDEAGWAALPVGLALLALAAGLFIGRHHGVNVSGPRSVAIRRLLVLAVCLLPFVIVLPLGAHWLAASQLEGQGYRECDEGLWIAGGKMAQVPETPARCRDVPAGL